MKRMILCAMVCAALLVGISGQNCAMYGTKAKKCTKNGCDFIKVNNAKFKTCVDPVAEPEAEFEPAAAQPPAANCPEITGARKCRRNAACDWAKKANEQWKTCIAKTPPTEAPTPAPAPTPATATALAPSWRKLGGCCRQDRQVIARKTYTHEIFLGVDHKTADKMCSDACTNAVSCTAFEVEKKKVEKRKPLRFRCELHSVNVDSVSRATPSCKRAQCFIKVPKSCGMQVGGAARGNAGGPCAACDAGTWAATDLDDCDHHTSCTTARLSGESGTAPGTCAACDSGTWATTDTDVCTSHTSCGNQTDATARLTGANSTAAGTCAACDSGTWATTDTDDCAPHTSCTTARLSGESGTAPGTCAACDSGTWATTDTDVCTSHTSCGNQTDATARLTGESATAAGTCAACDSGTSAASDTHDCASNDYQCDYPVPALVDFTTYTEHIKKEVFGNDLVVTIPAEMDGACDVANSTMYKSAIDLEWLELRHPVLGDALPTYDKTDFPDGGRENMTNMKDLAAAACSNDEDCLGFNWYKEKYVVFKSSAAVQAGDCAGKWSGCHKKEIRFYEKRV